MTPNISPCCVEKDIRSGALTVFLLAPWSLPVYVLQLLPSGLVEKYFAIHADLQVAVVLYVDLNGVYQVGTLLFGLNGLGREIRPYPKSS